MAQEVNPNATTTFLLTQKPQELVRLFETLIDQKIREVMTTSTSVNNFYPDDDSPFLFSKDVEKIFKVSRQTINNWRKSGLQQCFKIKSRRFFFKELIEQLRTQLTDKKKLRLFLLSYKNYCYGIRDYFGRSCENVQGNVNKMIADRVENRVKTRNPRLARV